MTREFCELRHCSGLSKLMRLTCELGSPVQQAGCLRAAHVGSWAQNGKCKDEMAGVLTSNHLPWDRYIKNNQLQPVRLHQGQKDRNIQSCGNFFNNPVLAEDCDELKQPLPPQEKASKQADIKLRAVIRPRGSAARLMSQRGSLLRISQAEFLFPPEYPRLTIHASVMLTIKIYLTAGRSGSRLQSQHFGRPRWADNKKVKPALSYACTTVLQPAQQGEALSQESKKKQNKIPPPILLKDGLLLPESSSPSRDRSPTLLDGSVLPWNSMDNKGSDTCYGT
ncbi:hypothetical protein AAY473_036951 [Plecturocebus cupreus]